MILGEHSTVKSERKIHYYHSENAGKTYVHSTATSGDNNIPYDFYKSSNERFSRNAWKYHKSRGDYLRKMMLKDKFSKQLGMKMSAQPDKSFGMLFIIIQFIIIISLRFFLNMLFYILRFWI